MKQRMINALYVLKECARRAFTPFIMYLFCGMLALAASTLYESYPEVSIILAVACVALAAVLNVDQGVRVGRKHFQIFLSGEVRRANGIATANNKDRNTYKYEMEYRPYKGVIIGCIICIPLIICCIVYASGGYFDNENLQSGVNLAMIMFCGCAIVPMTLIFGNVNVLWSLCFCVLPICLTTLSYIIGKRLEEKAYLEKQARIDSINNGEKPLSNREKKRRERENRRFR